MSDFESLVGVRGVSGLSIVDDQVLRLFRTRQLLELFDAPWASLLLLRVRAGAEAGSAAAAAAAAAIAARETLPGVCGTVVVDG